MTEIDTRIAVGESRFGIEYAIRRLQTLALDRLRRHKEMTVQAQGVDKVRCIHELKARTPSDGDFKTLINSSLNLLHNLVVAGFLGVRVRILL